MVVRNQISQNERESRVPLDSNLVIMRNWDLWWPFSTMSALMSRQGMLENGGSKIVHHVVTEETEEVPWF